MQLKVFVLPVKNLGEAEAEMNAFLRGHRVLAVKKEFVADGGNSFWSFCVEYLDGVGAGALVPPLLQAARASSEPLPFGFPLASRTRRSTMRIALSSHTGSRLNRSNSTVAYHLRAFCDGLPSGLR